MANRNFNRFQALEKEIKSLYVKVTVGALGAITLVDPVGIESVTRTAAGTYDILLQDKYISLKHVSAVVVGAVAEDFTVQIISEAVSSASPVISIALLTAGVATDPASGDAVLVKIDVKNSSAK